MTDKKLFEELNLEYVGEQYLGENKKVILFNFGNYTLDVTQVTPKAIAHRIAEHILFCQGLEKDHRMNI